MTQELSSKKNRCLSCGEKKVEFRCTRCDGGYCADCIHKFGEKAARILAERVYGAGTMISSAKIFDDEGRAFCPDCYGKLLDHSVKTGQWVIQSPEEAEPSVVRIDAAAKVTDAELANEPKHKTVAPGEILEQKIAATKKLMDVATQIIDLREQMALARQSLAAAQMRILLEPRGYGSPDEYRENCRAIMKNSQEIERVAKQWRRAIKKLGQAEPAGIPEALAIAAQAKSQLSFWERIRHSVG